MNKVKLAIVYYSATGVNFEMVKFAQKAAEAAGAEVRLKRVEELIPQESIDGNPGMKNAQELQKDIEIASGEDLVWADAILFSAPTRFGNIASQMKNFLDQQGGLWAEGKLSNKFISAMSSAQNPNGGQESTVKSIYSTVMHWGSIIVAPGFQDPSIFAAGGNPYGTTATQGQDGKIVNDVQGAVEFQAKNLVKVAEKFIN